MPENCTHDCSTCGENCADRDPKSFLEKPNKGTHVGKVIGVVSGKGGGGKSMITSLLAVGAAAAGKKAGVLDADITGPSIPRIFGVEGSEVLGNDEGLVPVTTAGELRRFTRSPRKASSSSPAQTARYTLTACSRTADKFCSLMPI